MSINFRARVIAGTNYYDEINDVVALAHTSVDITSDLDLGCVRALRTVKDYDSQDGMGSTVMTGQECIAWLSTIQCIQAILALAYIAILAEMFTGNSYVSVKIEWA